MIGTYQRTQIEKLQLGVERRTSMKHGLCLSAGTGCFESTGRRQQRRYVSSMTRATLISCAKRPQGSPSLMKRSSRNAAQLTIRVVGLVATNVYQQPSPMTHNWSTSKRIPQVNERRWDYVGLNQSLSMASDIPTQVK